MDKNNVFQKAFLAPGLFFLTANLNDRSAIVVSTPYHFSVLFPVYLIHEVTSLFAALIALHVQYCPAI
jgi:cytosine/uracil/thiamine/allantoin permease